MKKWMVLLLVLTMVVGLAACGNASEPETTVGTQAGTTETTQATEETFAPIYTRPAEDAENVDDSFQDEENQGSDAVEGGYEDESGDGDSSGSGSTGSTDGGSSGVGADTGDTFADGAVTSTVQVTAKPLTWNNINSFKIKSSGMSVGEMRDLCVEFFRFAKTALWTPDKSIQYIRNAKGTEDYMTGGSLYGGLPYVGSSNGNIYRLMDYIDESTGRVDMGDALKLTGGKLETKALTYFGNQCANGAYQGWGRVINSVSKHYTAAMTKSNNYIPLGNYKYGPLMGTDWNADYYGTDECCKENGEQVMYQAYAQIKKADGLVYYTTAGHVIMAATDAHVEYASNGQIDGNKSYITIIDQAQKWESQTSGGKTYQFKSSVDAKVTFKKLYSGNYMPYTFGEFNGTDSVEATTCSFSHSADTITKKQLFSASATSNYGITDAYAIVTDASGREVYKHAVRNSSSYGRTLKMAVEGKANVDTWGKLEPGTYTVKVQLQLATGERPVVYTGQLTIES